MFRVSSHRLFNHCLLTAALLCLAGTSALEAQAVGGRPVESGSPTIRLGIYDLEITFGGGTIQGLLTLSRPADSLRAALRVGDHDSPIGSIREDRSELTLEGAPGMDIRYKLRFQGDTVAGSFTYDGQPGTVSGKRRPPTGS